MNVIVRSQTIPVTQALRDFVRRQAIKLTKTGQKIERITVFLNLRKRKDWQASTVKFFVDLPGKNLVVSRRAHDMYQAIGEAADRAHRHLRKRKERYLDRKRR